MFLHSINQKLTLYVYLCTIFNVKIVVGYYIYSPTYTSKVAINPDDGVAFTTNKKEILYMKKGQKIDVLNFETKDSETSPPTRYNSGSIILAMENAGRLIEDEELREQIKGAGIGTSATRAEIMKKLEKINYIEINAKTQIITPSNFGEIIYDVVASSVPDMLNPKLTASWEKGLDMVAKKEIKPDEFMKKLENYIQSKFDKLVINM